MIKIGYFGDGPWASLALFHIADKPEQFSVRFITPRYDTQDPKLKEWAQELDVPFLPHSNVNDGAFIETIAAFECDVFVSMSFNQILKIELIETPPMGFINCHAGALPFYRGRNPLNWVLINGEKEFGVTVHYMDEGIDTGDIIKQNMVPIAPNDDYGDLLKKAHNSCADTLIEALLAIEEDSADRIEQKSIHPVGFYCGKRGPGDEWINWSGTTQNIHNFIRGIALPGPGARAMMGEEEVALLESRLIGDAPHYKGTNGEVVGRSDEGVMIKTGDSTLLITKACMIKEGNVTDAIRPRWRIGTRLKSGLNNNE